MAFHRKDEESHQIESKANEKEEIGSGDEELGDNWLSLGLNGNEIPSPVAGNSDDPHQEPKPAGGNKVLFCNFCVRKFYNSPALGGHQNAHRRERGLARRLFSHRMMMSTMGFSFNSPVIRSLGVQPHALVHKPNSGGSSMVVGRFGGMGGTPVDNVICPGSFQHLKSPEKHPDLQELDLDLRL